MKRYSTSETIRRMALYAMLGTILFIMKMALAPLPNIEPVSLLVMLYAVVFGWEALIAVYLYVVLEWLLWGFGLWSFCYLYVWLVLFILARLIHHTDNPIAYAILSGIFGLCFGALCSIVYLITGGWQTAVSWWITGIPWDLVHGFGNFFMALLLFKPIRTVLESAKKKLRLS